MLEDISSRLQETTNLGIRIDKNIIMIAKSEPERNLKANYKLGGREPLHATALGKALLSETPEETLLQLFDGYEFTQYTPNTITDLASFQKELRSVRECGYATDKEECSLGIYCVAVPVKNYKKEVVAAISVSTPTIRLTPDLQQEIIAQVKITAQKLSGYLGHSQI